MHFEDEQWLAVEIARVFAFFADPANLPRIMPPALGARIESLKVVPPPAQPEIAGSEPMAGPGTEIVMSFCAVPPLPFRFRWTALITEFKYLSHFSDVQKKGPLKLWHHTHAMTRAVREGVEGTLLRDIVDLEVGYGPFGAVMERVFIPSQLRATFAYRQRMTNRLLARIP